MKGFHALRIFILMEERNHVFPSIENRNALYQRKLVHFPSLMHENCGIPNKGIIANQDSFPFYHNPLLTQTHP